MNNESEYNLEVPSKTIHFVRVREREWFGLK